MGFSVFTTPLTRIRAGSYIGIGSTLGAGAGALLSRDDRRVSNAVTYGATGAALGAGLAAAQGLGVRFGMSLNHDARAFAALPTTASIMTAKGLRDWAGEAPNMLKNAARYSMLRPNMNAEMRSTVGQMARPLGRLAGLLRNLRK